MQNSRIEWTDHTFNPWWGCVNISPACDHCYAERFANRKTRTKDQLWGKDSRRLISNDGYWEEPRKWDRRAGRNVLRDRVFCGSMCDVMERREDLNEPRQRLFRLIEETPNLDWLLLTKRPQEYSKLLPKAWLKDPRPNVWLMTTVETAEYLWRIEALMSVAAVVHGVSCEPLLGPLTLPDYFLKSSRAWVIAGGESGIQETVRASNPDWFRSLRDQTKTAGAAFHFKQWGSHNSDLVKIGKAAAGRELDGRTWDERP
jgi:protein gp37